MAMRAHAPDAGARRIAHLLDHPDKTLRSNAQAFAQALVGVADDPKLSPAGLRSLRALRLFYRQQHDEIAAIQTSSSARRQVLDALDKLGAGLFSFEAALLESTGKDQRNTAAHAHQQLAAGAAELRHARSRLA
jgi:hypothetical protein